MKQNINHVDHIIWICKPENQAAYVARLSKLCRTEFHGPLEREDLGVRIYISWSAGLEIITPISATNIYSKPLSEHLDQRGEGLLGVVFGVRSIDEARTHAQSLGYEVSDLIKNRGDEPYVHETETMKEIIVGNLINTLFVFGEIKYGPRLLGVGVEEAY